MLRRVCDICGRVITDDMAVVKDEREIYTKCNPHTITISCPRDCDWDLCPSCREKLYSWVQEQKAAVKESFDAEDKEWGTMEERCNKEVAEDLAHLSSSEGAPGEVLMIDKYSGRPFWATTGQVEMAAREISRRLDADGGYDQVSINDFYK